MLTQCTTPTAPFYHLDTLILGMLEGNGIDLPCDMLTGIATGMICVVIALTFLTAWQAYCVAKLLKKK